MDNSIANDTGETKFSALFAIFCIWSYTLFSRPQDIFQFLEPLRPALVLGLLCVATFFVQKTIIDGEVLVHKQVRLYVAMLIVMASSIMFSLYSRASFIYVFTIYSRVAMFFFMFITIISSINKLKKMLLVCCMGIGLYSLYYLIKGADIENRLSFGGMFDPNDIAFVVISILIFNFLFLDRNQTLIVRIASIVNVCVGLILILKTGSRSGLVAVIIASTLLFFSRTKIASAPVKILLVVSLATYMAFGQHNFSRFKTILSPQEDYNMTDEEGRVTLWKIGLRNMITHPITGVGIDCFPEAIGRDRENRGLSSTRWQTAHNSLVQIGTETGVIGLALFFMLSLRAFFIFRQVRREACDENLIKLGEAALFGFSGHFVSAMFLSQAYSVYWAFYIGLSVILSGLLQKELLSQRTSQRVTCQES